MISRIDQDILSRAVKACILSGAILTLAACTSERFSDSPRSNRYNAQQSYAQPEPVEAIPTSQVSSEPLAPIGNSASPAIPGDQMGTGTNNIGPGTNTAALTPPNPQTPPQPSNRFAMVGGWNAKDATGASCRVILSSTPTLDLYRASTTGCNNKDLAKISAWDYRDGEIYLYQPGGTMTARLRGENSNMNGALTKSGAPISMSR